MGNSVLCSFNQLFSLSEYKINEIVIPSIQRDYAQGRRNDIFIERIRKRFLKSLKSGIDGSNQLYLDFVYGFIADGVMTPLDGQQRLTTLFLLYWYASKKEHIPIADCDFISRFSYKTRPSSADFCKHLTSFQPNFDSEPLSCQIINQSWFPYDWANDPTVDSMLNMIDSIDETFKNVSDIWKNLVVDNKIVFHFLSLDELGLTDDLYIKMNSRGKPLTQFECFKAELEQNIKDQDIRKRIIEKIDIGWTDFLWKYKNQDCLIDSFFLNYFRFVCDVISLFNDERIQERGYDEIDLLELYFSSSNSKFYENLKLLEESLDALSNFPGDLNIDLFNKFLTNGGDDTKVRIHDSKIDLLKDCFENYCDKKTKQRSQSFSFGRIILLYAFVLYCMKYDSISENEFKERIRIVNNLIMNSDDEMVDRATNSRLPAIMKQTKAIIEDGQINKDGDYSNGFNAYQIDEEISKQAWRLVHPQFINCLNKLENYELLYGQIFIVGLDNYDLFDKFVELFSSCDRDLISRALLTFGDYSQYERNNRHTFGTKKYDSSWAFLFHKNRVFNADGTSRIITSLLRYITDISDSSLQSIVDDYLSRCENNCCFDWKYYFIKYPEFRPDSYGKYFFKQNKQYDIIALTTRSNISEYSFQPFLKAINPNNLDKTAYGSRLRAGENFVYCMEDRFEMRDPNDVAISRLVIDQNNGIDTENRIEKYIANPLY